MWTVTFWKDALERAIKTAAQSLIALWSAGVMGLFEIDVVQSLSVAGLAALTSVLTSIASEGIGDKGTASLVHKD
jgi:hypothetical protein